MISYRFKQYLVSQQIIMHMYITKFEKRQVWHIDKCTLGWEARKQTLFILGQYKYLLK